MRDILVYDCEIVRAVPPKDPAERLPDIEYCEGWRGSALPWAKLDEHDAALIRALIRHRERLRREASELTNRKIAEKFGVHVSTIEKLASGETWTHVEDTAA